MIQEYLNEVLEEGDAQYIIAALGHIARSAGMSTISEWSGVSRTSLHKALSESSKPQFDTLLKVIRAVGGKTYS